MNYSKITISGKICTGKTTLFKNLQKKLKWPVFSTSQFFRNYAKEHNLSLESAEEQSDRITKKADFHAKKLLKKEGNIIVEGWLAGIMANDFSSILRILLIANDNKRIERFSKRENISFDDAKKRLTTRENSWLSKIEKIYDRQDIFDPKHYNLVINTANLTTSEVFQKVILVISKD